MSDTGVPRSSRRTLARATPRRWPHAKALLTEKSKLEARKKGYAVSEQSLENGSIKLQIIEGA